MLRENRIDLDVDEDKIVAVAARIAYSLEDGDEGLISFEAPARHVKIREALKEQGKTDWEIEKHYEYGFLTDKGTFLDRRQALGLAEHNGQIELGKNDCPGRLISDDIW